MVGKLFIWRYTTYMQLIKTLGILALLLAIGFGGYMMFAQPNLEGAQAPQMQEVVLIDEEEDIEEPQPPTQTASIEEQLAQLRAQRAAEEAARASSTDESQEDLEKNNQTAALQLSEDVEEEEEVLATTVPSVVEEEKEPLSFQVVRQAIASEPQIGKVFTCEPQYFKKDFLERPWIQNGMWYPDEKITIDGSVSRRNAEFSVSINGEVRTITGNGLPVHATGEFPVGGNDDASMYISDDASLARNDIVWELPKNPERADTASCVGDEIVGITLTGGYIQYGIGTNQPDAGAYEVFDQCGGQVNSSGYHYHRESSCILEQAEDNGLIGYALDGFGIFASQEDGEKITNADLDGCHGHVHQIEWDGEPQEMYHYHATGEFPYTVGCFAGEPITL